MLTGLSGLVLGFLLLLLRDTERQQKNVHQIGEKKSQLKENSEHLLKSPTKIIESNLGHSKFKGLEILFRCLTSPFMLLMFLAAASR